MKPDNDQAQGTGAVTLKICWSCNSENTDTNSFCADCGVPLDPKFEKFNSHIDDRIAAALDAKAPDQKLVEYQVIEAVVARLASWGRGLVILVAAIITGLGYVGFSEISGTGNFIENTKIDIDLIMKEIDEEKDKIADTSKGLSALINTNEEKTIELDKAIENVVSKLEKIDREIYSTASTETEFSEVANADRIHRWIWPDGVEAAVNAANVDALRAWIDTIQPGLPIAIFLNAEALEGMRDQAITDLAIP